MPSYFTRLGSLICIGFLTLAAHAATLTDGGTATLTIAMGANDTLNLVSTGAQYTFSAGFNFTNGGVANAGDFTGFNTTTVNILASGIARYSTIQITDGNGANANVAVNFQDSGANAYSQAINVQLTNATPGAVTFNGTTAVGGTLTVGTKSNIAVSGIVSTTTNPLSFTANQFGGGVGFFTGIRIDGGTVQSSTGAVTLNGTGGSFGSTCIGVVITNGGKVRTTGTSGKVTIQGVGGSTTDGTNYGVDIDGNNSAVTTNGGDISIIGNGGGTGPADQSHGILLLGGNPVPVIQAGGTGSVSLFGTGAGSAGTNNDGLQLNSAQISTNNGNITITADAGASSPTAIRLSSGSINAGGSGSTVTFVASSSNRADVIINAPVTAANGILVNSSGKVTGGKLNTQGTLQAFSKGGLDLTSADNTIAGFTANNSGSGEIRFAASTSFTTGTIIQNGSADTTISCTGNNTALTINGDITSTSNVFLKSTGNLSVLAGRTISAGAAIVTLEADIIPGTGAGDDGVGTLSLTGPTILAGSITLRGADIDINGASNIGRVSPFPATSTINILSSVPSRPMLFGDVSSTVAGINLSNAELGRLMTIDTSGQITVGDTNQTGDITLKTAQPFLGNNGTFSVSQKPSGAGGIVLDNAGTGGRALEAGGKNVILSAGTGGIVESTGNSTFGGDIAAASAALSTRSAIGTPARPIVLSTNSLTTDTSITAGSQFLKASSTVTIGPAGLSAGLGTIELSGASFALGGNNRIDDNSTVTIKGADLNTVTFSDTVNALNLVSGSISGSGTVTSTQVFQATSGTIYANIAATGGLVQTSGATTLVGTINYSNSATVNSNGTLVLFGSSATITGGNPVQVNQGGAFGGQGTANGGAAFNDGSHGVFSLGTLLAFNGPLVIGTSAGNLPDINLSISSNLPNGQYLLATYSVSGSSGAFKSVPMLTSGSYVAGSVGTITTSGGNVKLVVATASTDSTLSNLTSDVGTFSPPFASGTSDYTIKVPPGTNTISLTPTANDPNATITVASVPVQSGSPSGAIPIGGGTSFVVVCTAQDTVTKTTYNITVQVAADTPPNVSPLVSSKNPSLLNDSIDFSFFAIDNESATLNYSLNFGDGTPNATGTFSSGTNPTTVSHVFTSYSDVGFTVTLSVTDASNPAVTASTLQFVPTPSSTGTGIDNVSLNAPPIVSPLDKLSLAVDNSSGGVIQLAVDVASLTRAMYSVKTDFGDTVGRAASVNGTSPVHQFLNRGLFVAKSTATNISTGGFAGKARITLALSAKETGDFPQHLREEARDFPRVPPTSDSAITTKKISAKFDFSGNKLDTVSFQGTIKLQQGVNSSQPYEFWIAIGNIVVRSTIVKGKGTAFTPGGILKSLKVSTKLKKNQTSIGGEPATISVTYSTKAAVSNGFDTEGIDPASTDIPKGKSAPRKIQVAMLLDGSPFQAVIPVDFSLSKKSDFGNFSGRKN